MDAPCSRVWLSMTPEQDRSRLSVLDKLLSQELGSAHPFPSVMDEPLSTTLVILLGPELEETESLSDAYLLLRRRAGLADNGG